MWFFSKNAQIIKSCEPHILGAFCANISDLCGVIGKKSYDYAYFYWICIKSWDCIITFYSEGTVLYWPFISIVLFYCSLFHSWTHDFVSFVDYFFHLIIWVIIFLWYIYNLHTHAENHWQYVFLFYFHSIISLHNKRIENSKASESSCKCLSVFLCSFLRSPSEFSRLWPCLPPRGTWDGLPRPPLPRSWPWLQEWQ